MNVGNSYVANEVFQLNQIIDYGEYKNIDHFTKPVGNMVTRLDNQGYAQFNASGSKAVHAAHNGTGLAAMQCNNFVVQAGRYYKLQVLLKLTSGQRPTVEVCASQLLSLSPPPLRFFTAAADNGMLTALDATFNEIAPGYTEHVWEATAPGHSTGAQASVRVVNTQAAELSLKMNVQEFVF